MKKTVLTILIPLVLVLSYFLSKDFLIFFPTVVAQSFGPVITNITDNTVTYSSSLVPKYEKLEVTFQISSTTATNFQLPYDPNPPSDPSNEISGGMTVNAEFSQDNFQTIYTQPAFYYQDFQHQTVSNNTRDWIYPTQNYSWKVRWAPPSEGIWQYRLTAQDSSGITTSQPQSFTVTTSNNKGFIRVSQNDSRYFEYEDGTYFPGLGYNMNYNGINWEDPVLDNQTNFQRMGENGIQLIRIWLSEWSIYGSAWNTWTGLRNDYGGYIPRTGVTAFSPSASESAKMTMKLAYAESGTSRNTNWFDACRMTNGFAPRAPLKRNTDYRLKVKYYAYDITGPRNTAFPNYGFVVKIQNPSDGNWHANCYEAGTNNSTGQVISSYAQNTSGWAYLEGNWNSGNRDFMSPLYLALENVNAVNSATGRNPGVYIEYVELREVLPDGSLGPDVLAKSSMSHHLYFAQRNSYAFDKVLDLAKQNNVYLRPVILEKGEDIFRKIDFNGNWASDSDSYFYGNWRTMSKVRWLQQAWWRYLQARWGYSTNIQSWELLNEGDPFNSQHYTLADELGKYMRQFSPNNHLVSTSNWHSFPATQFWANSNYPNVDFADVHQYVVEGNDPTNFYDTALSTYNVSNAYGAKRPGGANKPVLRGETGFVTSSSDGWNHGYFNNDTSGIWLHKYIWGQINSGGLIESYWYDTQHIYPSGRDLRPVYKRYYDFIKDIPLSNGNYADVLATVSNTNLRAWGQKDTVNGRAHLWIDNKTHTWANVVNTPSAIVAASGEVTFSDMPVGSYNVTWVDPYTGSTTKTETLNVTLGGNVQLTLPSTLTTDIAVKIEATSLIPGDINRDGQVDLFDTQMLFENWNIPRDARADINGDNLVNGVDFSLVLRDWRKVSP